MHELTALAASEQPAAAAEVVGGDERRLMLDIPPSSIHASVGSLAEQLTLAAHQFAYSRLSALGAQAGYAQQAGERAPVVAAVVCKLALSALQDAGPQLSHFPSNASELLIGVREHGCRSS